MINSDRKAQPWAFGAVFKWDGTGISSESTIWSNSSTGASLTDMHIRAYIESGGELAFKYGDGNNYIMRKTSSSFISSGVWYGLYIDYDGYVANGTGSDLATQYSSIRIRLVDLSTGAVSGAAPPPSRASPLRARATCSRRARSDGCCRSSPRCRDLAAATPLSKRTPPPHPQQRSSRPARLY